MELPATSTSKLALLLRLKRKAQPGRWFCGSGLLIALVLGLSATQPAYADSAAANSAPADSVDADATPVIDISAASDPSAAVAAASANETLLLEVIVNGNNIGQVGEFVLRHGTLYARAQELRDLGFRVPNSRNARSGGFIALNDIPGFNWKIDTAKQQLIVTTTDANLVPTVLRPTGTEGQDGHRVIESGTGLTLNYDTVGTFANGQQGGSGSFDFRNFAPWGITSSDWMTYAGSTLTASGTKPIVRLDSAYTFADVNTLRRYSAGDFINGGLSWSRPVHMEGLQIRSDFTMRPDLITFPLPSLTGSATVPSTVDVLVNGNMVSSNSVNPGPFEVPQLPVVNGAGNITMTMTNAQGNQVTVTQPFYGGTTLLAKGLQTFAGQAGLVRRDWGVESNDYGKMAATGFYRRGLSQTFTVEATGEGTPGAYMGGGGGSATLWNRALVNFDAAASGGSSGAGELLSAGIQHAGSVFSLGGSATIATRNFRDVAAMNGSSVERKQISAFTSVSTRRLGSLGVAYAAVSQDPPPVAVQQVIALQSQSHIVTANYSRQFRRVSFYATEFRSLDTGGSSGLQVGITIPLGRRSSVSVGGTSSGTAQVQAQQSPVRIGDVGYQAYVSTGAGTHEFGVLQYKSPVGMFSAGADSTSGETTVRLESQGALSLVDRGLFPSNTIYDSFAVVDTAPVQHVHVFEENRDVGTTDKSGRLLVPDMRAFEVNHIGIEARDIPADADLSLDKRIVRPQDRSGVVVRFPVHFSHGALLKLVDQAGNPIPLGSTVMLLASGAIVPVGYDGEAYLEELNPHNKLTIELNDGKHCAASFDYKAVPGDLPTIGPIRCQEMKP